jgi:hypothetical protein
VQYVVLMSAVLLALGFALHQAGGWEAVTRALPPSHLCLS